ncbi:MAG: hypothetical protein HOV87_04165 [Catenulispora sp.]|nr:hypothetical protein [Catenulispora sp.]
MQENELARLFAAVVPEEVPALVDLHHRARAAGRRRRRRRAVLTASGTGVTVAGVVVAVVAIGRADPGSAQRRSSDSGTPAVSAPTRSVVPHAVTRTPTADRTVTGRIADTSPRAMAAVDAFKAALPAGFTTSRSSAWLVVTGDQDRALSSRVAPVVSVDLDVVDQSGGAYTLQASVGVPPPATWDCSTPSQCQDAARPGRDLAWRVSWHGQPAGQDTPVDHVDLRDRTTNENFLVTVTGKNGSSLPEPQDLVDIATNDSLITALEAADPSSRK